MFAIIKSEAQSRCEEITEDGEKSFKESGENSDAAEIEIKTAHSGQISFLSQDATFFLLPWVQREDLFS